MKRFLTLIFITFLTSTAAHALEPWQEKAVEMAKAEPKIFDAMWGQKISLWVSIRDDGTDRAGYAESVCLLLNEAGRPQGEFIAVTVWDVKGLGTNNSRQLGKAYCQ